MLTRRAFAMRACGLAAGAASAIAVGGLSACAGGSGQGVATNADAPVDATGSDAGAVDAGGHTSAADVAAGNVPSNYAFSPQVVGDAEYDYFFSSAAGGICRARVDGTSTEVIVEGERTGDGGTQTYLTSLNLDGDTLFYLRWDGLQGDSADISLHAARVDGTDDQVLWPAEQGGLRRMEGVYLYDGLLYVVAWSHDEGSSATTGELWTLAEDGSGRERVASWPDGYADGSFVTPEGWFLIKSPGADEPGELWRVPLDGSDAERIYAAGQQGRLDDLVIQDGRVYVLERGGSGGSTSLVRMGLDGSDVRVLRTFDESYASVMALAEGSLYVSLPEEGQEVGGELSVHIVSGEDGSESGSLGIPSRVVFVTLGVGEGHLIVSQNGEDGFLGRAVSTTDLAGNELCDYVSLS